LSKLEYEVVIISDTHLGSRGCQSKRLLNFLKSIKCKKLILNGDIIDAWRLKKDFYFPSEHLNVIRYILKMASKGTEVIYVTGNHDEFLRNVTDMDFSFSNIKVVDRYDLEIGGKKYLVMHGDMFDLIIQNHKWLAYVGDSLYGLLMRLNRFNNWTRHKLNLKRWSLSKHIKQKVKQASNYIGKFEKVATKYAQESGYDGIICGHIHKPEYTLYDGIEYVNSGDWVEVCSAITIKDKITADCIIEV